MKTQIPATRQRRRNWREPRTRSRYRFSAPAEFLSPASSSDEFARYRCWRHRTAPIRVVRLLSVFDAHERWYLQRRDATPSGFCWDNVDEFTRGTAAFKAAVKLAKRLSLQAGKPR